MNILGLELSKKVFISLVIGVIVIVGIIISLILLNKNKDKKV